MMWLANIANLALNLLLVPGTFGLPALGAVGGAWATFGAQDVDGQADRQCRPRTLSAPRQWRPRTLSAPRTCQPI